ncbi:MAG TPA: hypothetical protein VGA70_11120, partial [Longimicrobiales bacterium]
MRSRFVIRAALAVALAPLLLSAGEAGAQDASLETALSRLEFRELGPAIMGGRVSDLDVVEANPAVWYVGFASGGVWKTESHGMSWTPLFDRQPCASIGAVTIHQPNPNVVWVGTGEPQNRQSSPYGCGVFRSNDGGRTWEARGLEATRHISRIAIHPHDPDVVYVAAVGHLWGPNPDRGVYRTLDGGATWERVLYLDDDTGAIDLVMDPADSRTLFAAMYQRRRTSFGFSGSGSGSGLYRTTDGGDTWTELTDGLPEGDKGRIGIDVYRRDGNLVYALVEGTGQEDRGLYRSDDRGESWRRVSDNNPRPMYFSLVRIDPGNPERIYLGGVSLQVSDDGGGSWWERDGAEGIHVDHHALWVDPSNSNHVVLGNDGGVASTWDAAESWRHHNNLAVGQFYEIGVDMRDPYRVCGGLQDNSSWCGPSNSLTDYGIPNGSWIDVSGGDGFYNQVDPSDWRIVYTESQGGNISRVDVSTGEAQRIRPEARPTADDEDRAYDFNWNAPIVVSRHDPGTIYIGANHLMRSRDRGVTWEEASPDLTRDIDRDTLEIFGRALSEPHVSRNDGVSRYGTITTVDESPLDPGIVWVGTDDGNLQVTRDGGSTWANVVDAVPGLPARTHVSRVDASAHAPGRVYAAFDGHQNDDYRPWVFVSEDFGGSWRRITAGLPDESVNVVREHPGTEGLLFVGNERGLYVSIDRGGSWTRLHGANLPTVPVDDLVLHPRDNDLLIGTHGRSIWILQDVTPLERLARAEALASAAHLFPVRRATQWARAGGWPFWGDQFFAEDPEDGALIRYWLADEPPEAGVVTNGAADEPGTGHGEPSVTILDASGRVVRHLDGPTEAGINAVIWDMRHDPPYEPEPGGAAPGQGGGGFGGGPPPGPLVLPGTYTVRLEAGGVSMEESVEVRIDPRVEVNPTALRARYDAAMGAHALAAPLRDAQARVRALTEQLGDVDDLLSESEAATDEVRARAEGLSD